MNDPIASNPGKVLPFARNRATADRAGATGLAGVLRIGSHRVDLGALRVISDPQRPRLTLKAAMVLVELARRGGQTLSRDDLLGTVWAGTTPTPEVVTQAIRELRRVLGDNGDGPRQIETVPKLGYRLVVPVEFVTGEAPAVAAAHEATVPAPPPDEPVRAAPRSPRALYAAIGLVALAAAAAVLYTLLPRAAAREWRAQSLRMLTNLPGAEQYPHISSDGTRLAYSRREDGRDERVFVRDVDAARVHEIDSEPNAHDTYPIWSPGGSELALLRKDKHRCRIVAAQPGGGAVRDIGVCSGEIITLYDWLPDGSGVVSNGIDGAHGFGTRPVVQHAGRAPEPIDYPRAQTSYDLDPKYSPDGRRIAFRRGTMPFSDLYVMDAGDPDSVRRLTRLASTMFGYDWTRDGSALVFSSDHEGPSALFAVDVADGRLSPLGISPAIWPDLARDANVGVYEVPDHRSRMRRIDFAGGEAAPVAPSSKSDVAARVSPDGRRIVFISDRSGTWQVWLHDTTTGDAWALSQLDRRMPEFPEWRADGRAVAFVTHGSGPGDVREIDVDTRVERRIGSANLDARRVTYAPDGGVLIVASRNGTVALYRVDGARERELVVGASFARATATGDVLFNYIEREGLYRLDARDGTVRQVGGEASNRLRRGWDIVGERVYFAEPMRERTPVMRYDLASGALDELAPTDCGYMIQSLAVQPDERGVLMTCVENYESDVALLGIARGE